MLVKMSSISWASVCIFNQANENKPKGSFKSRLGSKQRCKKYADCQLHTFQCLATRIWVTSFKNCERKLNYQCKFDLEIHVFLFETTCSAYTKCSISCARFIVHAGRSRSSLNSCIATKAQWTQCVVNALRLERLKIDFKNATTLTCDSSYLPQNTCWSSGAQKT